MDERTAVDGTIEYQLLWKGGRGRGPAVMTWEPADNLTNCDEALADWTEDKDDNDRRERAEVRAAAKATEKEKKERKAQKKAEALPPEISAIKLRTGNNALLPASRFGGGDDEDAVACRILQLPGGSGTRGDGMVLMQEKGGGERQARDTYYQVKRAIYKYRKQPPSKSAAAPAPPASKATAAPAAVSGDTPDEPVDLEAAEKSPAGEPPAAAAPTRQPKPQSERERKAAQVCAPALPRPLAHHVLVVTALCTHAAGPGRQ